MIAAIDTAPVQAFLEALRKRDFDALQRTFAPDVRMRGLTPSGLREAAGADESRAWFQRWFGDADPFEMQSTSIDVVVDRVHASYRIRCREGGVWYICEQQLYAQAAGDKITALNLLCSGFRSESA